MKYGVKKRASHAKNVEVWRELSHQSQFSPENEYWTLADPDSVEYESMHSLGVLKSNRQYHVVNDDESKIEDLKKKYPEVPSINFHLGDWCHVVSSNKPCVGGGIVYIDTMEEPDHRRMVASTMLASTMNVCGAGTLICMNLCYTRARCRPTPLSLEAFFHNTGSLLNSDQLDSWLQVEDGLGCFGFRPPKTRQTQMLTLYFWREPNRVLSSLQD
jgi:hypothetical protein